MKALYLKIRNRLFTREIIVYLIFGILTTAISYAVYLLCVQAGMSVTLSNTLCTIVGVCFAFVTNKIWVFESREYSPAVLGREFLKFCSGRLVVYLIETALLILLVDIMNGDKRIAKAFTMVIVVVLNYFVSKKAVFK